MKLKEKKLSAILILLAFVLILVPLLNYSPQAPITDNVPEALDKEPSTVSPETEFTPQPLTVHYIDVGQADCILIQTPAGKNILIDAGNNADSDLILAYLRKYQVDTLDVIIGTHPHEDHIGALDSVINFCNVKKIYLPRLQTPPTSKTYRDVLNAIKNKHLTVSTAKNGVIIDIDPDLSIKMLAPNSGAYESTNDYSAVIKLSYQKTSFLFTGDAEAFSEAEILAANRKDLKADILKAGHHGSRSSSSSEFLAAVNPKNIIISVGNDNRYGHPHQEVLSRLLKICPVYRTDKDGTVIIRSNGKTYQIETER